MAVGLRGHLIIETEKAGKCVFKPVEFFSSGFRTIPYNEMLAYQVSYLTELDLVPETSLEKVALELNGEEEVLEGSIQKYVKGLPLTYFKGEDLFTERLQFEALKLRVFDALIANVDRSEENVIVDMENEKLWAIDNSFSLGFHIPTEFEKREEIGEDRWYFEPLVMDYPHKLGLPDKIIEASVRSDNQDDLHQILDYVQRRNFALTDEDFYGNKQDTSYVFNILRNR